MMWAVYCPKHQNVGNVLSTAHDVGNVLPTTSNVGSVLSTSHDVGNVLPTTSKCRECYAYSSGFGKCIAYEG